MKKTGTIYRLVICAILFALLFFTEGCVDVNQLQEKVEKTVSDNTDIFLTHMEEKYDVPFLPVSYTSGGVVVNEEFRCYAEGTDRERDYVSVFRREENGEDVFYDDYFGVLIRDEYQNRVQKLCEDVVGESKAYVYRYSASFFDNTLTAENTIDDAIAMGDLIRASKYIFFEVKAGDEEAFKADCDRIARSLAQGSLTGMVKFIGLAEGQLEQITGDNFLTYLPSMVKPDGSICLMMTSRTVTLD